ncbi:hypothetical protein DFH11DRAFT_1086216 [Phellopilus nigrolimitatus]|nr:hypothetical protein DFH11DRAFT_1086216 [Phellopilus nigrolimitatus]
MNISPAVTEVGLHLSSSGPCAFDMQALSAFWRQEENIDIYLLAAFADNHGSSVIVLCYSFAPQTRTFEHEHTASPHLNPDEPLPEIFSSQSGRLAVLRSHGLYGSDIHRILREEPTDGLRRMVLPRGIKCHGMDPYSGAILGLERVSTPVRAREVRNLYFD